MLLVRRVTTEVPTERAFAYLADFTTTTEWDPGTVRTTLISGDGGVGTRYRNVSRFLGRTSLLIYEVVELQPGERIVLRGENAGVVALDTITVQHVPAAPGAGFGASMTEVTYQADFTFKGLAGRLAPLLALPLQRLGDRAQSGMDDALRRLV